ncbi:response regulator [Patescibacteria group bacterium]|nr:response regulator [Patescibacteria group bacterium]
MSTILIVEDEPITLDVLSLKLRNEGFEVFTAKNGEEGLQNALKKHPDLILADIIMPIMDGTKMIEEIRKDEWGKSVPIIVLTNLSRVSSSSGGIKRNVSHYLLKTDWKLRELIDKIKEELAK